MTDSVVQQCDHAARLADLINGAGPTKVSVVSDSRVVIERAGGIVEIVDDIALAQFVSEAPGWLRRLAEAVATVYAQHTPQQGDGPCPQCGGGFGPCPTRRLLEVRIQPGEHPGQPS